MAAVAKVDHSPELMDHHEFDIRCVTTYQKPEEPRPGSLRGLFSLLGNLSCSRTELVHHPGSWSSDDVEWNAH